MNARGFFSLCAIALTVCSVGCGGEVKTVTAATQLLVSVDIDPALLAQVDRVRATVWSRTASTWKQGKSVTLVVDGLSWPVDLPLLPGRSADESATVELVLEAVAGARVLAETRVLSSFVPNTHRQLNARLSSCAGHPAGFVCSTADCHGDACSNCSSTGECVPVVATTGVDMSTIAPVDAGQAGPGDGPGDAGKPADGSSPGDAGGPGSVGANGDASATTATDSGLVPTSPTTADAALPDAGLADTGLADAGPSGPTPKVCPVDHGCVAPYPCVPTALGYTCLGQFADWPMPDGFPTTKHVQSYTSDGVTVVDTVTKLEWETNVPLVHEGCTKYPEYYEGGSNVLKKGMTGEFCSLVEARKHCADTKTAGKDDWRLPSMIELASLLDHARIDYRQAINANYFPDIEWSGYVTNSLYPKSPASYRGVDFVQRETTASLEGEVRCVRGGTEPPFATPAGRYTTDLVTDTATDNATGLIWQRKPSPLSYMSDDAAIESYCLAPFRLPTPNELLTLVDPTRDSPAIDTKAFPDTPSVGFFAVQNDRGRTVDFATGDLASTSEPGKVRCVR